MYRIELLDIKTRRKLFLTIIISITLSVTGLSIGYKEWVTGATFLGIVIIPFIIALLINQFQGALVSIEMTEENVLFNYAYILTDKTTCKKFRIRDIKKVEYSDFTTRLSIESNQDKLYINVKDTEKTPIKAFVEKLREKLNINRL
ncbi:MAG: hypothetical protein AABY44_04170 [Nitrospirota bacterium]